MMRAAAPLALALAGLLGGAALAQAPGQKPPAAAAPATAPAAASSEARAEAQAFLAAGFGEGFFGTFWTSFRQSLVDTLVQRSGRDRAQIESAAEEVVMPIFQARRPELEASLVEMLATQFTPAQLRSLRQEATASVPRLQEGLAPVMPALQATVRSWSERVLQDNQDAIRNGLRARGLGR
jgi:hypothetical protein